MRLDQGLQVGVLGTGLSALAAAHYLKKAGHVPTVLDTDRGYVRLGRTFTYGGRRFDQFLQPIAENDLELCNLSKELGVTPDLQWHGAASGLPWWRFRRGQRVATPIGFSQALELELRSRLDVNQVGMALDLMEFDHTIEVRTAEGRMEFDAMITTLSLEQVEDMARGLIAQDIPRSQARHRTLVNVVFISPIPLLKKYSTFVDNAHLPFTAVSSITDVDSGLSCINVSGYSEASEVELRILATKMLCENFPEFQPSAIEAVRVFQSVERIPVYQVGDTYKPIQERVGEGRLFLASRELAMRMPVSMNTDILLAKRAVNAFLECAPTFACGERRAALAAAR